MILELLETLYLKWDPSLSDAQRDWLHDPHDLERAERSTKFMFEKNLKLTVSIRLKPPWTLAKMALGEAAPLITAIEDKNAACKYHRVRKSMVLRRNPGPYQ